MALSEAYQFMRFEKALIRNMKDGNNRTRVGADSNMIALLLLTSINQSINQSIDQSINQSINQINHRQHHHAG